MYRNGVEVLMCSNLSIRQMNVLIVHMCFIYIPFSLSQSGQIQGEYICLKQYSKSCTAQVGTVDCMLNPCILSSVWLDLADIQLLQYMIWYTSSDNIIRPVTNWDGESE